MSCYSVLAVTPTTEDWIPSYLPAVGALVAKHGGQYKARTASHKQLEGSDAPAALRIIIEWPSMEAAHAFMDDPDYAPYLKARSEGAENVHFVIDGKDDLA
ncbi:MAG: DUF1330 domain-containing protein [Pseudomonadota bacterium]